MHPSRFQGLSSGSSALLNSSFPSLALHPGPLPSPSPHLPQPHPLLPRCLSLSLKSLSLQPMICHGPLGPSLTPMSCLSGYSWRVVNTALKREEGCPAMCGCVGMVTVGQSNLAEELSGVEGLLGPSSLHCTPFSCPERH